MVTCIFGFPGCGKSTYLASLAYKYSMGSRQYKKYKHLYTINFTLPGFERIDFQQLGVIDTSDSLILIDEITFSADNRDFKNFQEHTKQFFLEHRHLNCDVVYATQYYNWVDLKILKLTERVYYIKRIGKLPYSVIFRIPNSLIIPEQTGEISTGYKRPGLFGVRGILSLKKYVPLFDSYDLRREYEHFEDDYNKLDRYLFSVRSRSIKRSSVLRWIFIVLLCIFVVVCIF